MNPEKATSGNDSPAPRRRRISWGVQRYLAVEILRTFVVVLLVFEAVVGCVFCFGAVRDFGLEIGILLPLLVPALAAYLDATVPLSLLFATALAYGRFTADREVAALKSFGHSYLELCLAPLCLAGAISAVMLLLNFFVIPDLRFGRDNLGRYIVEHLKEMGEGGSQSLPLGKDRTLWIQGTDGERLRGVFIAGRQGDFIRKDPDGKDGDGDGQKGVSALSYPVFLIAQSGEVVHDPARGGKEIAIRLHGVTAYYDTEITKPSVSPDSRDFKQAVEIASLELPVAAKDSQRNNKEMLWGELRRRILATRERWQAAVERQEVTDQAQLLRRQHFGAVAEVHRRLSMTISTLFLPLCGALVSLFLNSTNRFLPLFASLLSAPTVYYLLEMRGSQWARHGHWPWLSAELGNVGLAFLCGVTLLALRRRTLW